MRELSVSQIKEKIQAADADELKTLERLLASDDRKGVRAALDLARRRVESELLERKRLEEMYSFELEMAGCHNDGIVIGLDEVGRGPLAGPVAVGAVVLSHDEMSRIDGLDDSKRLSSSRRRELSQIIKDNALAWDIQFLHNDYIDDFGISTALKSAFRNAVEAIERNGIKACAVLVDGNPIGIDEREVNIVKGDAKCASIAAASIIAKVARDSFMEDIAEVYPGYGFEKHKGYGTKEHIAAIERLGLSPIHRKSFCSQFIQQTLF